MYLMTTDSRYSFLNRDDLREHFQMQLSQKGKLVSEFFFLHFLNLDSIWNILEKKDDPHG